VKVFSYTEPREALLDYDNWLLGQHGEWRTAAVADGKRHGKTIVVRIDGVEDRDSAAALIGSDVAVERAAMPMPEHGSYYWSDIEGMRVEQRDGTELGRVVKVLETGANDVMVVDGERERLIPFVVGQVVLDVDVDQGLIRVDWDWD
jgi:16S rRNA processing protein RimM